jgi:glycosyltransferase involved in cell wall biosynthesis
VKIWLIQTGERLPISGDVRKMRTALLADALLEQGHEVEWWAAAFDHFKKEFLWDGDQTVAGPNGVDYHLLKGCGYSRNVCLKRFVDHRIIARKFSKQAGEHEPPDFIVVSTPPHDLAYEVARYAKQKSIPIIVDIRDPWPDLLLNHLPRWARIPGRVLLTRDFRMMKTLCGTAAGITAVTETMLHLGLRYAGRPGTALDKVYYLGYKKQVQGEAASPRVETVRARCQGKFVVLFIGTLAAYHDPSVMIDAASTLAGRDIRFVIAGDGEAMPRLRQAAEGLDNVLFTGWLGQPEIDEILTFAHLGVCPTPRRIDLFPNKAFLYMSAGLPLLNFFDGDLRQLITRTGIGANFGPGDGDSLAAQILDLSIDSAKYARMRERVRELFQNSFDAGRIYSDYVRHVEEVHRMSVAGSRALPLVGTGIAD